MTTLLEKDKNILEFESEFCEGHSLNRNFHHNVQRAA